MKDRKGFSKVNLSSLAPLRPINRDAITSITRSEEVFDFNPVGLHKRTPLPWRLATEAELANPLWVELFGEVVGRLTVVGVYAGDKQSEYARWVVKCVCGAYEVRRARYIKACLDGHNPGEDEPMCQWCQRTNSINKGYGRKPKIR